MIRQGSVALINSIIFPFFILQNLIPFSFSQGNYGNEIDGISRPTIKKKKDGGDGNEEESELLQNDSDEEANIEGEFFSVSTSPALKPLITDRQVILASLVNMKGHLLEKRKTVGSLVGC